MDSTYSKKDFYFLIGLLAVSLFMLATLIITVTKEASIYKKGRELYLNEKFGEAVFLFENKNYKTKTDWHNLGIYSYKNKNYLYSLFCFMQVKRFGNDKEIEKIVEELTGLLALNKNVADQLPYYKLYFLPWIFLQFFAFFTTMLFLLYFCTTLYFPFEKNGVMFLMIASYSLLSLKYLDTKNNYGLVSKNGTSIIVSPYNEESLINTLYQGQVVQLTNKEINNFFLTKSIYGNGWIKSEFIIK